MVFDSAGTVSSAIFLRIAHTGYYFKVHNNIQLVTHHGNNFWYV